jgi:hypothetical protein
MKVTQLQGWSAQFVKQSQPQMTPDGNVEIKEMWAFVMVEQGTGDQIIFGFGEDIKEVFVKQLTGGIIIAGGL